MKNSQRNSMYTRAVANWRTLLLTLLVSFFFTPAFCVGDINAFSDHHGGLPADRSVQPPSVHSPESFDLDARAAMGVTASLIEQYLHHALTSLRLIAAAPATRSGIWPEIRPAMVTLCQAIPGAALYIEADGNYYSVERGYTGLNLSDRDYFEDLFNGHEIHGSLIYSRSTGKQSVLMAVPVIDEGEVTGAVALSIFLDDFQQLISESLSLPDGYLWYVIDENASTVLHPRRDFVFMNPAEQGSPSLRLAIENILAGREGYTTYVFAGRNTCILYTTLNFNNWRLIFGKIGEPVEDMYMPKAYDILDRITLTVRQQIQEMDRSLQNVVLSFGESIPAEHIVRNTFRQLYRENPFIVKLALINRQGMMMHVEPSDYVRSEGTFVADQESFFMIQKTNAPVMSSSYLAVEGFDAVNLTHPIIDNQGNFQGAVKLLIRPDVMIEELVTPYVAETIYDPWIIEPEGRIIFDKAKGGTGRMLFLDYRYEEQQTLLELGDKISDNQSGRGDYIFIDPQTQRRLVKMAIWDTFALHSAEWRIILSYPPYD